MKPLLAAAVIAFVGCSERPPAYVDPPATSFTTLTVALRTDGSIASVPAASVTPEFFETARVAPLLGRFFLPVDQGSSTPVVVISQALWAERFGSAPNVIGQAVSVDGRGMTIVGVGPRGFQFPRGTMLWIPAK
jgi:MacB-like protein